MEIPFTNGFYQLLDTSVSNQQCINLVPNIAQAGGVSQNQLIGIEGLTSVGNTGGKVRGAIKFKGQFYQVSGNSLFKIEQDYSTTNLGTISGGGRVSIVENGSAICIIVPGVAGYFYTIDDGLEVITDPVFTDYANVRGVEWISGFFIYHTPVVMFSGSPSTVNDGRDFDALAFVEAEAFTDEIVSIKRSIGQLYVLGEVSIEVFRVGGSSDFPLARVNGSTIERGLFSEFCSIQSESSVFFIGGESDERRSAWVVSGAQQQKISTNGIDHILNDLGDAEFRNGFAWSYGNIGHSYVGWTFSSTTIVYDTFTSKWHERQSNSSAWSPQTITGVYDKLIVGGLNGEIGILDDSVYTEYGATIRDRITTQPFRGQGNLSVKEIELLCESGVGNADSAEPTIGIRTSKDDGYVWSIQRTRGLGASGDRRKRQVWRNLGRYDDTVVFEISISEPVKKAINMMDVTFG